MFEFPSAEMVREMLKKTALNTLIGFENTLENGKGHYFNFILSNGARSKQRDEHHPTKYSHIVPSDLPNKIRSVNIFYDDV